ALALAELSSRRLGRTADDHRELLGALRSGPAQARAELTAHLQAGAAELQRLRGLPAKQKDRQPGRNGSMALQLINRDGLPTPSTYTHVIVAAGSKVVFIAGQEPEDAQGNLVGPGDLAAQARQVFANLGRAVAAGGARLDQVPKITIF